MSFKQFCLVVAIAVFVVPFQASYGKVTSNAIKLDYNKFTLKNGLTVIVHEDHKAPVIFVGVWYHVGSKDEPAGKTGFAHLFEHLMFNGTEDYNKGYFKPLQEIGAINVNGSTWLDRTNYYETVPTGGLDRALWMESERMGHLLGAISQKKLDQQRAVVKNEKRQGDNRPYAKARYLEFGGLFPAGHPYHHLTIGSMKDLSNASLKDVKNWFRKYYGPTNAVVVLAGDINLKTAKKLMTKYFADIAPGAPLSRAKSRIPNRTENTADVMYDEVPQAQLRWLWAVPGRTNRADAYLTLASAILGTGKNARLYKKLVHETKVATDVSVQLQKYELASVFSVTVTIRAGENVDKVRAMVINVMARFLKQGPDAQELARVKAILGGEEIRALESVSGMGRMLATGQLYANNPNFINVFLGWMNRATTKDIKQAASKWLANGAYRLTILPFGRHERGKATADRSKMPGLNKAVMLTLPPLYHARLKNGIKVILAERHSIPVINMSIQFNAGTATDKKGREGTANYAFGLMNEGTRSLTSLEMSNNKEMLGANIGFDNSLDSSDITLSALKKNIRPSVKLWADVIQNPGFRKVDFERDRILHLNDLKQAKVNPRAIAMTLLAKEIYGKNHPYGLQSQGTEKSLKAMTRGDLFGYIKTWIRPDNATIFVVGDTTLKQIMPLLEEYFGKWQAPKTPVGRKNIPEVSNQKRPRIFLVNKPGSPQAIIVAGQLVPSFRSKNFFDLNAMNDILGGNFSSRLNMDLREKRGWSYGTYSGIIPAKGQGLLLVVAPVQINKTAPAIKEILKDITELRGKKPPTTAEVALMQKSKILTLPGKFQSSAALLGYIMNNEVRGRAYKYVETLPKKYRALTPAIIEKTAKKYLYPNALTWVVVGDLSKIEQKIRALKIGTVEVVDAAGNRVRQGETTSPKYSGIPILE